MSTEKQVRLPSTDEVNALGSVQCSVEHLVGTVLVDRYRLTHLLGSGGAAVVYRAEHTIMHKLVAVKILRPELAQRQDFVRRFLAEARTVARLRHENIVDIVDVGRTETGLVFCVMEYLEGEELGVMLAREGRLPWRRARDVVTQVCRALAAAHAVGVVHRDIKPQNCFRVRHGTNEDFIKLLDFGISKQLDNDQGLTATGMVMGTAEYMSPEQARGRNVDARTDIYATGAMLFELLAGRPPFEGETFLDVLMKHASEPVPNISDVAPGLDPNVGEILRCALAKNPADRFPTVQQFIVALNTIGEETFVGLLDTRGLKKLEARPESMLARASGPHARITGALKPKLVAATFAAAVAVVGVGLSIRRMLAEVGELEAAVSSPRDAPTSDAPPPPVGSSPLVEPPPPTTVPALPPAEPEQVPDAQPPSAEPSPPDENDSETERGSEGRAANKATPATPRRPAASKVGPDAASKRLLTDRIRNQCGDAAEVAVHVELEVTDSGFDLSAVRYTTLRTCIRNNVSMDKIRKGRYELKFGKTSKTPRTIDPLGD